MLFLSSAFVGTSGGFDPEVREELLDITAQMEASAEETGLFNGFSIGAVILINIVIILIIRKIFDSTSPFMFNTDTTMNSNRRVENVENWNKQHAKGLMVYDLALTIVFLYPVFGLQIDGGVIDGMLFIGTIIFGLIGILIQHNILSKKYVVKKY